MFVTNCTLVTGGYNAPLPPTPERPEFITDGVDLRNDTSYLEPDSVDGYLKMDAAAVNTGEFH